MREPCPIVLKRGGTLALDCALQQGGVPVPIAGWQVDCWLRGPGGRLVQMLSVELVAPGAGRYRISATPAQTTAWPLGQLEADIRYADEAGRVMHTGTFAVRVGEAITTPTPSP